MGSQMTTTCNNCLDEFSIEPEDITITKIAGLEIQYFTCPSCGAKYVAYAADEEMQKLTAESIAIQRKIRLARQHKFREKTIRASEAELAAIRERQKKLEPKLKGLAELLLKDEPDEKALSGLLEDD